MTGVEAVSDGVRAFRPPEAKNAAATLVTMAVLAIAMFTGITFLAHAFKVVPHRYGIGRVAAARAAGRHDSRPDRRDAFGLQVLRRLVAIHLPSTPHRALGPKGDRAFLLLEFAHLLREARTAVQQRAQFAIDRVDLRAQPEVRGQDAATSRTRRKRRFISSPGSSVRSGRARAPTADGAGGTPTDHAHLGVAGPGSSDRRPGARRPRAFARRRSATRARDAERLRAKARGRTRRPVVDPKTRPSLDAKVRVIPRRAAPGAQSPPSAPARTPSAPKTPAKK